MFLGVFTSDYLSLFLRLVGCFGDLWHGGSAVPSSTVFVYHAPSVRCPLSTSISLASCCRHRRRVRMVGERGLLVVLLLLLFPPDGSSEADLL